MNKKLNNKIIILVIIISILLGILSITSIAYNNTDRNKIIGIRWTSTSYEKQEYDLRNVKQVSIIQHPAKEGDNYVSILNQPNVWCVQHGKELRSGEFSVSEERPIRSDVLAYILNHGPAMGTLPDITVSPSQIALWQYLYDNSQDPEVKEITNGNTQLKPPLASDPDIIISANKLGITPKELLNDGLQILEDAKAYANSLGNQTPTLILNLNGDNLDITVGGNFKEYKLYINDVQYTVGSTNGIYGKDFNGNRTISVSAESIGAGEAKVRIEALATKYFASYRALQNATQQRLIVVTNASSQNEITGTTEKTQPLYTNVSLQKYITKVNNKNLSNDETDLQNRKNTYSTTSEADGRAKKHPSKTDSATNQYKRENAVQIEAGDTVTYRIYVYNNSNITAKRVDVRDKLLYYGNTQYGNYEILSITRDGSARNIKNEWKYVSGTTPHEYQYTINNLPGNSSTYFDVTVKVSTYLEGQIIDNTAYISSTSPNNKDDYRTLDRDYIKMKPYKVSLQKIVYSVNGNTQGITSFDRWTSWESNENIANPKGMVYAKHNNPVIVSNGDYVTYAIKVRNDGDTKVYINNIKDTLPEGLSEYKQGLYNSSNSYQQIARDRILNLKVNRIMNPGDEEIIYITAKVSESNISTKLLRNYAEITEMSNQNKAIVQDATPNNNQDADYIALKDIIIAGTVWNDRAFDKGDNDYNGKFDNDGDKKEDKLNGITVKLYREGTGVVAETQTETKIVNGKEVKGYYQFSASMIDKNIVTHACERHIKAPYECSNKYTGNTLHGANYWKEKGYYSYYIVFEYDGITYTNTVMGDINAENYQINSNAKEDNGPVKETRKSFNDRFSTINNQSKIEYTTKNENEYIPQSNHVYNEETMSMQSSTNLIQLSNSKDLEDNIQHINLGLRGRDIFDLELTSDVYSTKLTVNGQSGVYQYGNKVPLRNSDIGVAEDMANKENETYTDASDLSYTQLIRNTDLSLEKANEKAVKPYTSTGLRIEVTYKITVMNASQTVGTASKIINYYDNRYDFKEAYAGDQTLSTEEGPNGSGYASRIITTPESHLEQSETMDIYVVYSLKEPTTTLDALLKGTEKIPTYNMAEVYEYKTFTTNNNEATRGLLDKDSAPGSVGTEQVRLVNGSSNDTTVEYYFKAQNLSNLKYEDDTYSTPTLYFAASDNGRKLSGVVFRDNTITDNETRIKTGNGIKDEGEVGVYGATVELVEMNQTKSPEEVTDSDGIVRYQVITEKDGTYTFEDFLPGNYVVRYHYGDTTKTVLLKQDGDVNNYSFNGEDYQSTNNIGAYGAKTLQGFDNITGEFTKDWYAFNKDEGVSTGTDNEARRESVTTNVTNFTDEQMTELNKVRDGEVSDTLKQSVEKEDGLINQTNMYATTPNFTLTVEETVKSGNEAKQNDRFMDYKVSNMNFGISEVPVTTIDLQKHVNSFTIKDSAGTNTIAKVTKQTDGNWKVEAGNVLAPKGTTTIDVSIEDEKLQGARLEVTYDVSISMTTEKDFRNREITIPTIEGIADFIDNDLSYNENLGENSKYWKITNYDNIMKEFAESKYKADGTLPQGTVDSEGKLYTTIVRAKGENPILLRKTGTANCPITLEKVLSAQEVTVEDIITSSINTYEYNNNIEITKLDYGNAKSEDGRIIYRDRIRTPERYIILAGTQHDSATSETIAIHPPTGENGLSMNYYIIAMISLIVLATGVVFIKKYAIKK